MPRREYDKVVTLNKRKRGIIRKAIELCRLCDQEIYIAIFDKSNQTFVQYKSTDMINPEKLIEMQKLTSLQHEKYDNGDYDQLSGKFITRDQFVAIQNKHLKTWADVEVPQEL
jgi:hypothetical protein